MDIAPRITDALHVIPTSHPHETRIPHALAVAYDKLMKELDAAIAIYERTLRFPKSAPVVEAVDRFVHEVHLIPHLLEELKYRSGFVESACCEGSQYQAARARAINRFTTKMSQHSEGRRAIGALRRKHTRTPISVGEIVLIRRDIKAVLREESLTSARRQAFSDWLSICRTILREAERLEADGCLDMYHVYLAAQPDCSVHSEYRLAFLQSLSGGAALKCIRAAADSMMAFAGETNRIGPIRLQQRECAGKSVGTRKKDGKQNGVPKRRWTQAELEDAIRDYKAKRGSTYSDLRDAVKRGKQGAKEAARQLFGRNAIVRALGVKSPAMVTYSFVWQHYADELGLREGSGKKRRPAQRIGMEIAQEVQAVATGESVVDQVVRRETISLVERSMPPKVVESIIAELQRGEISDDRAREFVELYVEQSQDDRTRKVREAI